MKALKKVLAVLMACLFVFASMHVIASAEDAQPQAITESAEAVEETVPAEETQQETAAEGAAAVFAQIGADVQAAGVGSVIGRILGTIVFSPFLLIDLIVWVLSGFNIHIFYWWFD